LCRLLGAVDLEVVAVELDGGAWTVAVDAVAQRLFKVQVEWVAKVVGLGVFLALAADAALGQPMLTEGVAFELSEDVL